MVVAEVEKNTEFEKPPDQSYGESDDSFALLWVAVPLCAMIVATGALYFAKPVLLPLAIALILSVVFSPVASRLERYVGRLISAALVVLLAIGVISAIGYFLTVELTSVADQVAGYSDNIGNKLAALEKNTPPWIQHIQEAVTDVQRRVQSANPAPRQQQRAVVALPVPNSLTDSLKPVAPIVDGLVNALLIIMLLFFLLYSRKDLRDRFVRLAARARIPIAALAIETAGATVGHYLLLFSLINLAYGVTCGLVAWMLGLPSAPLWGLVAFLLRFIPYVGAMSSAILPALVAFALFPGWGKALEILGAFVLLDQIAAQLAEPFIIGHGIDVSPVALLISAMYWSWMWGIPGLLLSTPITACLKVAGDYIPPLGFLSILLGADRVLDDYHDFYRMLLELDPSGARKVAVDYCDEQGLERTFEDVIQPALELMGQERAEDHISDENQQLIIDTTHQLIPELGNRFVKSRISPSVRALGVMAPAEVHYLGLLMLLELLRKDGVVATFAGEGKSQDEICDLVKRFTPDFVLISCMTDESLPATLKLVPAIRAISSRMTIIAGGPAAVENSDALINAGCAQICTRSNEARRAVRSYILQRAKSRLPFGTLLPRRFARVPIPAAEIRNSKVS
ncbi:MAG TPA: AI-2E family transporter [Candidatus Acidoferrum sp.]|nr:AI-2E family transporter [Candidatus Acidoferrum sp.]